MSTRSLTLAAAILGVSASAQAALRIAVVDTAEIGPNYAAVWCDFFESEGHECVVYPASGPTGPLDSFKIIVDLSESWSDPGGALAEHMQRGGGLLLWGSAPSALGIDSLQTVRDMIGANAVNTDFDGLVTVATDPILGDIPVGTMIAYCGDSGCRALDGTAGHPNARALARLANGNGLIGLMRNEWGAGQSVYLVRSFGPETWPDLIRRIIAALSRPIPAASTHAVLWLFLLMSIAGTVLIRKPGNRVACALLVFVAASPLTASALAQDAAARPNSATTDAAQPPGPGLPLQAPSVNNTTSGGSKDFGSSSLPRSVAWQAPGLPASRVREALAGERCRIPSR